jgi:hypothetical protein
MSRSYDRPTKIRKRERDEWRKARARVRPDSAPPVPSIMKVKPVALNQLLPGRVVWAHVPFVDGGGEKTRPAVVVSANRNDVTLLPASSSTTRYGHPSKYLELHHPVAAGLVRATGLRLTTVTVPRIEILSIGGELAAEDLERLADAGAVDISLSEHTYAA